jgi:hypothetical protein
LTGKPVRKISLRRPKHRWENYIEVDLKGTVWEVAKWIHVAQDD